MISRIFYFSDYINSINSINAINDNLPDDLLNDTVDFGLGGPPSSSSSGPMASTSAVGSIAPGGGPPQVVVASSMGMNNGGGSTLNGITTTNCVQSQPMMTSTPQMMGVRAPSTPNKNLVNALQGAPGSQQGNFSLGNALRHKIYYPVSFYPSKVIFEMTHNNNTYSLQK